MDTLKINKYDFEQIFKDKQFYLPIRWDGKDYAQYLANLYNNYQKNLRRVHVQAMHYVRRICDTIIGVVLSYLNGFPASAYSNFSKVMNMLSGHELSYVNDDGYKKLYTDGVYELYRVVGADQNIEYNRTRVFHTPYNMRSKVATCRYSIAGYPSLYLGTNLELCCQEIGYNPHNNYALAARYEMCNKSCLTKSEMNVIELALKPQDFFRKNDNSARFKHYDLTLLDDDEVRGKYLEWYPLIAACSFIRVNKKDPFAVEYIIPQILMQWLRSQNRSNTFINFNKETNVDKEKYKQIVGIRYFSCVSDKASEMGFNYVFPVSGSQINEEKPYCKYLASLFELTKPYFLYEYDSIGECENDLIKDIDLQSIL